MVDIRRGMLYILTQVKAVNRLYIYHDMMTRNEFDIILR